MPIRFAGADVTLYLEAAESGSGLAIWGCCQQLSIEGTTEMLEVTPINGRDTSFLPTYDSVTISANGLYVLPEYADSVLPSNTLWDWRKNHTLLNWLIVTDTIQGVYDSYSGQAYISSTQGTFNNNEASLFSVQLVGVGVVEDYTPGGPVDPPFSITCPIVVLGVNTTEIDYSFEDAGNTTSIIVELFNGASLVSTETYTPPYAVPITDTISGLTPGTTYDLKVTLNNTTESYTRTCDYTVSTESIPGEFTVTIYHSLAGCSLTSVKKDGVDFIDIVDGAFPLSSGGEITGNHTGFTGIIEVTVSGSFTEGNANLIVNGSFVACVSFFGVPGTYSFPSDTYLSTDEISITINAGSCE